MGNPAQFPSRLMAAIVAAVVFFCNWAPASAQNGTHHRQWWVSAPQPGSDLDAANLAMTVDVVVATCRQQVIVCEGLASGGSETWEEGDSALAHRRETECVQAFAAAGVTAMPAGEGADLWGRAGPEGRGVRIRCAGGSPGIDVGSSYASDALPPAGDVAGNPYPEIDQLEEAVAVVEGLLADLDNRVDSLEAQPCCAAADPDGSGEGSGLGEEAAEGGTSSVRLVAGGAYQHRRTAHGFRLDLGARADLGRVVIQGGVSSGLMSAIFQDRQFANGQTIGGYATILGEIGEEFELGVTVRYEELIGALTGDDESEYQRVTAGPTVSFHLGESWGVSTDLFYERSVDEGALAPNGVGAAAHLWRDIGQWGRFSVGATAAPEISRW